VIEHLFHNAHGEWDFLRYLLLLVPFAGPALFSKFRRKPKQPCPCGHEGGERHA
jgi:hypothetical protein